MVRGAHASRVLLSASRRERFGGLGRDAQANTRDACAPRTTDIGFCNAPEQALGIFTPLRPDSPRSADVSPQAIVRQLAGETSPTPVLHREKGNEVLALKLKLRSISP